MKYLPQLPQGLIKQLGYNPSGRKLEEVSLEIWEKIQDYIESNYTQKNISPSMLKVLTVAKDILSVKRG